MEAMIVGGGAREHALAWKIQDECDRLFIAPGNAGTELHGENVAISPTDIGGLVKFAKQNKIDYVVIGPDDPLALGLVDRLNEVGISAFGPTQAAHEIESSKSVAKEIMKAASIPTASYKSFTSAKSAIKQLENISYPTVIKADDLQLGKGVEICYTTSQAEEAIYNFMEYGTLGKIVGKVLVESFVSGDEMSLHGFSDGKTCALLPASQDYKTINEDDNGPMTGGMGSVAPIPYIDKVKLEGYNTGIFLPILKELEDRGTPFTGMLFPGLKGDHVLEFNGRFGDPEAQVYMRLLKTNLLPTLQACSSGNLERALPECSDQFAACVVLASEGYPQKSTKGDVIEGVDQANQQSGVVVFHAGTQHVGSHIVNTGGRTLSVTATADTLAKACHKAYEAVKLIDFRGKQYRGDIGRKAIKLCEQS